MSTAGNPDWTYVCIIYFGRNINQNTTFERRPKVAYMEVKTGFDRSFSNIIHQRTLKNQGVEVRVCTLKSSFEDVLGVEVRVCTLKSSFEDVLVSKVVVDDKNHSRNKEIII
ncbi:hypothetical protein P8452_56258 [Trifolium repens]|nr:hypothetical protein P8452_56258 [Trifolium repens]